MPWLVRARQFHGFFNVSCHIMYMVAPVKQKRTDFFFDIFMMILIDSDFIESLWSLYILNPHWLVFYDYLSFHSFWFHKLKKMIIHSLSQLMGTLALIHLETNPISLIQIIYYVLYLTLIAEYLQYKSRNVFAQFW